jgi:hypothetical protein
MIMENTRLSELSAQAAADAGRFKFVCVVLQYAGPKLHRDKLTEARDPSLPLLAPAASRRLIM